MSDAPGNPRYLAFAQLLRQQMKALGLNASDLARAVWGETTDRRGYKVARNRDRIGHYLAGKSFPEDANLHKLAGVLELPYADLAATRTGKVHRDAALKVGKGGMPDQLSIYPILTAILQLSPRMRLEALKIIELLGAEDTD